jgi:Male sterility protein.
MNHYFFTGCPGFIANRLIPRLLETRNDIGNIYLLVLPEMEGRARGLVEQWRSQYAPDEERFHILVGDITKKDLGLKENRLAELQITVTHVFHLAAIYDLAVPRDPAYRVNVDGTRNVNEWVKSLKNLTRYIYFSTAYVAGTRTGIIKEDELIRPEEFKNYYEESKFEAEVLVEDLKREIPLTIIRPGIVKGHSQTGETGKFDGPYMFLNLIDKLRNIPVFPRIGNPEVKVNLVPVDFVLDAVLYLSHAERGAGKTYHLTDPNPYTVEEIYALLLREMLGRRPKGRLPISISRFLLSFPGIRKKLRIEKETLDYLNWRAEFDCRIAQADLAGTGIACPDFKEQVPSMVKFYLEHKDDENYQIPIR